MLASIVPPYFFYEVVSPTSYLINIQPSSALHEGISYDVFVTRHQITPLFISLFGCVYYMLLASC